MAVAVSVALNDAKRYGKSPGLPQNTVEELLFHVPANVTPASSLSRTTSFVWWPSGRMETTVAPAPHRLKRRAEFLRVAAKGQRAPMPGLVLQSLERDDQAPVRVGFTVTKKVGNAVVRNRVRRRLREAVRLHFRDNAAMGADLVLIGRDGTRTRDFQDLMNDLRRALARVARAR